MSSARLSLIDQTNTYYVIVSIYRVKICQLRNMYYSATYMLQNETTPFHKSEMNASA